MKKVIVSIAIVLGVVLAALNAALLMPPTGFIKPLLVEGVHKATGLELSIGGRIGLRLVPNLNLTAEDVTLADPGQQVGQPLLQARSVELRSDIWPLLRGMRDFERLRLVEPRIVVSIDKNGRSNWPASSAAGSPAAGGATTSGRAVPAPGGNGTPSGTDQTAAAPGEPSVARLLISGGKFEYSDARDGTVATFTDIEANATSVTASRFIGMALSGGNAVIGIGPDGAPDSAKAAFTGLTGSARNRQGMRVSDVTVNSQVVRWLAAGKPGVLTAEQVSGSASNLSPQAVGAVVLSSATVTWADQDPADTVSGRDVALSADEFVAGRLKRAVLKAGAVGLGAASARGTAAGAGARAPVMAVEQVTITAPVLALGEPIDADASLVWNKDRIAGHTRLPAPDALAVAVAAGPPIPAMLSVVASHGQLDFTGDVFPGPVPRFKGRTKAATPSLEALAQWLGVTLPDKVAGAASFDGDLDAQFSGASPASGSRAAGTTQPDARRRVALTNGRIQHDATVATGALTIDFSGPRLHISGKLASDKLDANTYLGLSVPKPTGAKPRPASRDGSPPTDTAAVDEDPVERAVPSVPVKEALKAHMRAMLAAAPGEDLAGVDVPLDDLTRSRPRSRSAADTEWSDETVDLSALRTIDLDLEVAVKSLTIRQFDVAVPQLKAVLKDGALALDAANLSTRGGRLSGRATVDARQSIPHVAASFTADGVDVYELSRSIGITALIAGSSNVEADLTGSGASQKQLVETLSGRVKARVGQGSIVGYDFSSALSWLFGDRTFDPRARTPFARLDADVAFDKGVARDSTVELTGSVLGGNADGTIKLPDKQIDYRARFKLSSLFTALSLRIFGEWDKPSVTPDLGDVFSRSAATRGPGGASAGASDTMSPLDMLASTDLADPELADLISRVLDRAGPRGLPAPVADTLRGLQARALGERR